ncbi:MAG: hypothetical protein HN704_17755 [Bacteroidetes bacterium]|jgi:hypothetical protein|nr:hypothetical protein [Bacteroidota bacterium]MBT6687252.1 hypothetical protein [Bacteroidota bacterium]MBT7143731.1 hypothetical protein [Bacteroidota bacterium]MBT7493446.1 hypothetical protein [Bacteroidota bacterium]
MAEFNDKLVENMFEKENASGIVDFYTLLFFVSIALILLAIYKLRKGGNKKVWTVVILLSICTSVLSRIDLEVEELVIIEDGYIGNIKMLFNESCGEKIELDEDGNRLFNIPDNGVLIVNESNQKRFNHSTYYYKNKNNQLVEIPQMDRVEEERGWWGDDADINDPDREKVGVYFRSKNENMQSAYVCSYNELNDMINASERIMFVDSVLLECRGEK